MFVLKPQVVEIWEPLKGNDLSWRQVHTCSIQFQFWCSFTPLQNRLQGVSVPYSQGLDAARSCHFVPPLAFMWPLRLTKSKRETGSHIEVVSAHKQKGHRLEWEPVVCHILLCGPQMHCLFFIPINEVQGRDPKLSSYRGALSLRPGTQETWNTFVTKL
jgi:hypothetical protein